MRIKSTLIALGVILSPIAAPVSAFSANKHASHETHAQAKELAYKQINAKELKSWIDSGKQIQLIDARPKKFEGGDVIVGAKFLAYDSDEKAIARALPSKEAIIVTYCASTKCPASAYLSNQLVDLGYKNVYKYPGGIADWMAKDYPTQKSK